ncbi:hypothetical protein IEO21_02361 [Rhodonia placenta]|uniref:Phospholipid-transporting ATPase n=1 Tax=Rhodonia placenta TaxID=104341 RepID=A0A8H7U4D6_9APHY|nr:hypothetical protein IEO21_02361 [Postia placenta]
MATFRSRVAVWYSKASNFNVEALFTHSRELTPRTVYVHEDLPEHFVDPKGRIKREYVFCSNQVITSKYSVITFLPRNLLEQFRRVANIFFLAIAILQFFPIFPTVSPGLAILPLLVVLAITGLKDGYEDFKRHQADHRINRSRTRVLHGGVWRNPNPMQAKTKTFIPAVVPTLLAYTQRKKPAADVEAMELEHGAPPVGVSQSGAHEQADEDTREYDEDDDTSASDDKHRPHWQRTAWEDVAVGDFVKIVDNESFPADILICATSEEENVCFVETKNLDGETNLKSRNACAVLTHLRTASTCADSHNAFHVDCDRPETNLYKLNAAIVGKDGEKTSVDSQMVLLRGSVLRNTGWVIGLVLFTGLDSKIVLNSGGAPSKRSKVERQMNPQVFINLGILAAMAVACAIADAVLEQRYYPRGAPWLYLDNQGDDNTHVNGIITWAFALITFQNIIPISLYISIEAVRTCQALFIYFDHEMYHKKTDSPTLARSWNLSDDLGQIEYIFSDKTGTLTQNAMIFRQCSVGGRPYRGTSVDEESTTKVGLPDDGEEHAAPSLRSQSPVLMEGKKTPVSSSSEDVPDPLAADSVGLSDGVLAHFHDAMLSSDIVSAVSADDDAESAKHARLINGFFTVLALCHTALASIDPITGAIAYKAQSPDEAALVQAAADVGFVFRGRDKEILTLQTPFAGAFERWELLNILEFNSSRKRMSVIVRKLDEEEEGERLFLLTKGADNVIFERLVPGEEELKRSTEVHLDEFAGQGLRTLTLAYKTINEVHSGVEDDYEVWARKFQEASVSLDDREAKLEAVYEEIEGGLSLLGATAIEDRLQDGVPEAIADLKLAGIKVWVATGDKVETAIAIGHSTNLIGREDNIIVIRGGVDGQRDVYTQMYTAVEEFFPESGILGEEGVSLDVVSETQRSYPLQRVNTAASDLVGHNNGARPGGFVLVVDGGALATAFGDDRHKHLLLRLAMQCEGVICCRVSPLQKALIVKLVKDGLGAMTLAIGDGANDVSMIQAADVGVGISGEEGLQAANSSDYAIAQFRFLRRLILVHGHWSYARNGSMIVNFFYKNMICIGVLWWFQIYCAWSSQYVFEYTYLLWWNTFFTIAPVIAIGLFDRIVDDHVLVALPELYAYSRRGGYYDTKLFLVYMLDGIVQGVYSAITPGWFSTPIYGNDAYLWPSAYFWFCILLTVVLALLPRYLCKAYKFAFYPADVDRVRWLHKIDPNRDFSQYKETDLQGLRRSASRRSTAMAKRPFTHFAGSHTDMSTGTRSQHRGFDFATEENGVALQRMQTNLSERQSERQKHPFRRRRNGSLLPSFSLPRSLRRRRPPPVPESPPTPGSSYSRE